MFMNWDDLNGWDGLHKEDRDDIINELLRRQKLDNRITKQLDKEGIYVTNLLTSAEDVDLVAALKRVSLDYNLKLIA